MIRGRWGAWIAALGVLLAPLTARAAGHDNNVEWLGISHVAWEDRRPLCPVDGESFEVRFQTFHDDLTSAQVVMMTPAAATYDAHLAGRRGPYDVWSATVPATAASSETYYLALTDGFTTHYLSSAGMSTVPPAVSDAFGLDFVTLGHAPLGATLVSSGGTVFRTWAPDASTAYLRGEFNAWGLGNPMTKVGEYFVARVPSATDRKQYKYFFNNSTWKPDARGRALNPGSDYNTYIENPFRYTWGDTGWMTPALDQMVIYQLHVGMFAGLNDPQGPTPFPSRYVDVAARVSHLKDLGVNAVMINPFTEFPGDFSGGYDPVTQWAPESKYGTPDELKSMIDVFHANGIAVLLDIVWNHFSNTDNYLWNYDGGQIYFDNPQVETPWGSQADFDRLQVRDYFVHSAMQWLQEFHLDGFRMDATSYMTQPGQANAWGLMQRYNDTIDNRWGDKVSIAEQLPNDAYVTRPTGAGGAGFDSQYYGAFRDAVRQAIFAAASGDPQIYRIRDAINGSGTYLQGHSVVDYIELHDEAWASSGGQRLVKTIDTTAPYDDIYAKGRTKLGQGLVLTAPGVPAFLMGTEWLESNDFGTGSANRLDWSKKVTYAPIMAYYKKLIGLRRSVPALWSDADRTVTVVDDTNNLIVFRRAGGGKQVMVIANFSNSNISGYRVGLPAAGNWVEVLNSQSTDYSGNGFGNAGNIATDPIGAHGYGQSAAINIPQMGLLILAQAGVTLGVENTAASVDRARIARVSPSPARTSATIEFTLPRACNVRLTMHDVSGRRVATLADRTFEAGTHSVAWHADPSASWSPGVYFVRLETPSGMARGKLLLVR